MAKELKEEKIDYGQAVKAAFEDVGWRFTTRQLEDSTLFALPMSAKNSPGLNIRMEVSPKGDCKIRCYLAQDTPKSVYNELLEVLNTLNSRYRYVTLSLDSDGDVLAAYDFAIFSKDPHVINRQVSTLAVLLCDIMDKCIPPIMKVVWSAENDDEDEIENEE